MKRISAFLLALIIAIAMMPLGVFADAYDFRTYGPNEPMAENIENWVLDCKDDGANPIYYDEPVFETDYEFDIADQETETLGANIAPIRPKMDCDINLSITSNYAGNIYLGAWTVEEQNGEDVAVKLGDSIKKCTASISLKDIKTNEKIQLVISLCGDYSVQQTGCYELNLKAIATPIGDKPEVRCEHVPTLIGREEACCGWNGHEEHYECQDCWTWLIKDETTGKFREMTKKEIKSYTLKMPAKKHSFTKKVRNADTRIRKASCTKAAKYYYTCKNCGIIGNKTFTYGKKLGHNYKKNYVIPATTEKNGKIGHICTRCKKVKAKTKTTTIPKIDSMSFVAKPYVVQTDEIPKFVVKNSKGKKIKDKYYEIKPASFFDVEFPKIPMDVDGDNIQESSLVMVTANFSGRYSGTVMGAYVETSHEITDEWIETVRKFIEENLGDTNDLR